jgi:hypothetical protein
MATVIIDDHLLRDVLTQVREPTVGGRATSFVAGQY